MLFHGPLDDCKLVICSHELKVRSHILLLILFSKGPLDNSKVGVSSHESKGKEPYFAAITLLQSAPFSVKNCQIHFAKRECIFVSSYQCLVPQIYGKLNHVPNFGPLVWSIASINSLLKWWQIE